MTSRFMWIACTRPPINSAHLNQMLLMLRLLLLWRWFFFEKNLLSFVNLKLFFLFRFIFFLASFQSIECRFDDKSNITTLTTLAPILGFFFRSVNSKVRVWLLQKNLRKQRLLLFFADFYRIYSTLLFSLENRFFANIFLLYSRTLRIFGLKNIC